MSVKKGELFVFNPVPVTCLSRLDRCRQQVLFVTLDQSDSSCSVQVSGCPAAIYGGNQYVRASLSEWCNQVRCFGVSMRMWYKVQWDLSIKVTIVALIAR